MESNDQLFESIMYRVYNPKWKSPMPEDAEIKNRLLTYFENAETDNSIFVAREILWVKLFEDYEIQNHALNAILKRIGAEPSSLEISDWEKLKGRTKDAVSIILDKDSDRHSVLPDLKKRQSELVINAIATRLNLDYVCPARYEFPKHLMMDVTQLFDFDDLMKNDIINQSLLAAIEATGFFYLRGTYDFKITPKFLENYSHLIKRVVETEYELKGNFYSFIEPLIGNPIPDEIVDALVTRTDEIADDIREEPFFNGWWEDRDGKIIWSKGNLIHYVSQIPRLDSDNRIQFAVKEWAKNNPSLSYGFWKQGYLPRSAIPAYPDLSLGRQMEREDVIELANWFDVEENELQPQHWVELGNSLLDQTHAEEAGQAFIDALELDPQFSEGWIGIGNALQKLGFPELGTAAKQIPDGDVPEGIIREDLVSFFNNNYGGRVVLFLQSRIFGSARYCEISDEIKKRLKDVEEDPASNARWFELGRCLDLHGFGEIAEAARRVRYEKIGHSGWIQLNDLLETHKCTKAAKFIIPFKDWL